MISKERFTEIWNETIGPYIEDGTVVWECSPQLAKHLIDIADLDLTDEEIAQMIDAEIL